MSFQLIVGHPETARREKVTAVPVVLKGAGLAYQPVDYMPVLNMVVARTAQPGDIFDMALAVPYLQVLCIKPHRHLLTNKSAVYRVNIVLYPDSAARPHSNRELCAG